MGPNRAPGRKVTPLSKGTPTTATSARPNSSRVGKRAKVEGPAKRGTSRGSRGPRRRLRSSLIGHSSRHHPGGGRIPHAPKLSQPEGGIAEEVIDGEKLGERTAFRVSPLGGQNGVAQTRVRLVEDLLQEQLVELVRRRVQAQPARRERGNRSLALGLQYLLGQRVEVGEVEVAVQAIQGQQKRLLRLGCERGNAAGIEEVFIRPEVDAAVTDVAHQRGSRIEGFNDALAHRRSTELGEVKLANVPSGQNPGGNLLRVGDKVSRLVRIVGDQRQRSRLQGSAFLKGQYLRDHRAKLLTIGRRQPSQGQVGQNVVSVHRGQGRVGGRPQVRGF